MTYQGIVDRIADNLGIESQSSRFLAITKQDILDSVGKLYRKAEPIKADYTLAISSSTTALTSGTLVVGRRYEITTYVAGDSFTNVGASSNASDVEFTAIGTTPTTWTNGSTLTPLDHEISLPSDFFIPLEVLFYDSDGLRYASKEITYEEFLRWEPDVDVETESFNELVTSATPTTMLYTQENLDLDGLVGYCFSDEATQKLKWKPSIDGEVTIHYVTYPTATSVTLTDTPSFHKAFHELIGLDVTVKQLVRKLSGAKSEIELYGLNQQIGHFKQERDKTLSEFAGYVTKTVSTPVVEPFNFLNDNNMIIFS